MITAKELAAAFAFDLRGAKELTKGLNHADSILQPPARGNCMNWVLGHMLDTRNDVLKLLGQPGFLSEAQAKRYGYGSQPVCEDGADIVKLETAMALLEKSQPALEAALIGASEETLNKEHKSFMGTTSAGVLYPDHVPARELPPGAGGVAERAGCGYPQRWLELPWWSSASQSGRGRAPYSARLARRMATTASMICLKASGLRMPTWLSPGCYSQ